MTRHFGKRVSTLTCALAASAALALSACSSRGNVATGDGQISDGQNLDFAIAYIKRTIPTDTAGITALRNLDDVSFKRRFWNKADVYLRQAANPSAVETNITASVTGSALWDAKDLDVSPDGTTLVFALRGPLTADQKDFKPPTWHIWTYNVPSGALTQLTGGIDDLNPNGNDVSPHFLPDSRIVFSSTRQVASKEVLTNEGQTGMNIGPFEAQTDSRNESAFVLHVMNSDGSNIHQISFNQSHDSDASVLSSGRILYTRWDNAPGRTDGSAMHLYTANPDGSNVQLLYGAHSHNTISTNPQGASSCPAGLDCAVQFVRTRQLQDGRVLALVRPFNGADFGGNLQIINVNSFLENNQALPDTPGPFVPTTTVAQSNATGNDILTQSANQVPVISPGGRFSSAEPLWDGTNRVLVTWNQCRLQSSTGTLAACTTSNLALASGATPTLTLAPPLYSAWLLSLTDGTLKPVITPVEGVMVSDIVSLQPRTFACTTTNPYSCPQDLTVPTALNSYGILDIRSVYDRDGVAVGLGANQHALADVATAAAANRPARFLRIESAVSIGDKNLGDGFPNFDQGLALGGSTGRMSQMLGYVPIEPDGSVRVLVPANIAFKITVLDSNARALPDFPSHNNWLSVRPGEILSCNGCHTPTAERNGVSGRSHGRSGLFTLNNGLGLNAGQGTSFNVPAGNGTVPTMVICAGDTMAQELNGTSCGAAPYTGSNLSPDVLFNDPWFNGNVVPTGPNGPIAYQYAQLTVPRPIPLVCQSSWSYFCVIVIDYPLNIDPLWSLTRTTTGPVTNATCTACHTATRTTTNALGVVVPVPADGNLALDDPSPAAGVQLQSYQQLVGEQGGGSINPGSASGSCFFQVLSGANVAGCTPAGHGDGTVNHAGFMTAAELRLMSEWVDIGAQYYNNPFDVPAN